MGKAEIIKSIVDKTGVDKKACRQVLDTIPEAITEELIDTGKSSIIGLAQFEVIDKPPRRGRDPQTGEVVEYPATKAVKAKISQNFKDAVIKGKEI